MTPATFLLADFVAFSTTLIAGGGVAVDWFFFLQSFFGSGTDVFSLFAIGLERAALFLLRVEATLVAAAARMAFKVGLAGFLDWSGGSWLPLALVLLPVCLFAFVFDQAIVIEGLCSRQVETMSKWNFIMIIGDKLFWKIKFIPYCKFYFQTNLIPFS